MTGVLEGFRWSLFGAPQGLPFPTEAVLISVTITVLVFASGLCFFRHMERTFADMV